MKKFILFSFLLFITLISFSGVAEGQSSKIKSVSNTSVSSLNGCWKRISVIVNGKPEANPLEQIRLFNDGFYTYIGEDSAHNWTRTFGGTYDISNNIFKETTRYSSFPAVVGVTHWQEFKITGDTVSFKLFTKMIDPAGKELPQPAYTRELILVRVKK